MPIEDRVPRIDLDLCAKCGVPLTPDCRVVVHWMKDPDAVALFGFEAEEVRLYCECCGKSEFER